MWISSATPSRRRRLFRKSLSRSWHLFRACHHPSDEYRSWWRSHSVKNGRSRKPNHREEWQLSSKGRDPAQQHLERTELLGHVYPEGRSDILLYLGLWIESFSQERH